MTVIHLPPAAEQIERTAAAFGGQPTRVLGIPHRICPLGAHVDHQGGQTLGRPIGVLTTLAYEPTDRPYIRLISTDYPGTIAVRLQADKQVNSVRPSDDALTGPLRYVRAATEVMSRRYSVQQGMLGLLAAPAGGALLDAGLSSSASVTIAVISAIADVNGLTLNPAELVELARIVENDILGLPNGILDQSVIAHGKSHALTLVDPISRATMQIPDHAAASDARWLLIHSGISRQLTATNYAERVAECRAAAARLQPGACMLSDVTLESFEAGLTTLPRNLANRARHYFGETARVSAGIRAWEAGDLVQFGQLMNESCRSSIDLYESGHPVLITLQEELVRLPGVYGSRFSGGGFGGCIVALVNATALESVAQTLVETDSRRRVYLAPEPDGQRQPETAIVLAAGRGARLRPLTDATPKPLLPIDGRPTLDYIMDSIVTARISSVILVIGHLGEQIEQHVDARQHEAVEVLFCRQSTPAGTADAVRTALDAHPKLLSDAPWLVTAADYALPADYIQTLIRAHALNGADITVALKQTGDGSLAARSSAAFRADGRITEIVEKPMRGQEPSNYVASLTGIFPAAAAAYFRAAAATYGGVEVPWTAAVNAMIADGYIVRGVILPPPAEFKAAAIMTPQTGGVEQQ